MNNQNFLYLQTLNLQNFAIIKSQTINFCPKFNAIIGETGSGKSLILDALQIILGGRVDKRIISKDSQFATLEAKFNFTGKGIQEFFDEIGHPIENDEIIIKRVIYANGSTKNFLNYSSCNATTLTKFARKYIDLACQFENQKLLSEEYQLLMLDNFSNLIHEKTLFETTYNNYTDIKKKLERKLKLLNEKDQQVEFLNFNLAEINKLNPTEEEEQDLLKAKSTFLQQDNQQKVLTQILDSLSDNQDGHHCTHYFQKAYKEALANPNIVGNKVKEQFIQIQGLLEEVSYSLTGQSQAPLILEEDINGIIDKLDIYQKFKRKYGGTIESILQHKSSIEKDLQKYHTLESDISSLSKELLIIEKKLMVEAEQLHIQRTKQAKRLSTLLTAEIRRLKMPGATIQLKTLRKEQVGPCGITQVLFMAETNPGEGKFKVKDIASGGELSRILLALRQLVAQKDTISIFLFDEIDAGVGGETALTIGKSLANVAQSSQIIAITHLPQIAHFSDKLIVVTKKYHENNRTVSSIEEVAGQLMKNKIHEMTPVEVQ